MVKKTISFSMSEENISYIDDQWPAKGKRSKSHWLDDLITHLREKKSTQVVVESKPLVKRFQPPEFDEACRYFAERGCMDRFEVEKFMDFYAAKGWMVGKNKMKDWKAAVRNWLKGAADNGGAINGVSKVTQQNIKNTMGDW